jgi:hypothetical protein
MFAAGLRRPVGWQPSRFLTDRGEAERAYALAEQLGRRQRRRRRA